MLCFIIMHVYVFPHILFVFSSQFSKLHVCFCYVSVLINKKKLFVEASAIVIKYKKSSYIS